MATVIESLGTNVTDTAVYRRKRFLSITFSIHIPRKGSLWAWIASRHSIFRTEMNFVL